MSDTITPEDRQQQIERIRAAAAARGAQQVSDSSAITKWSELTVGQTAEGRFLGMRRIESGGQAKGAVCELQTSAGIITYGCPSKLQQLLRNVKLNARIVILHTGSEDVGKQDLMWTFDVFVLEDKDGVR